MLQLRPFQKQAIAALEPPGHVICVSPTGSGKSLIYEKCAEEMRVLLVSPLIALARQQRERIVGRGIPAALWAGDSREAPPLSRSGAWIVSPESLLTAQRTSMLRDWRPDLLVVDECHCLWEWGERFRPAFLELPSLIQTIGIRRTLWLTATLPPAARAELHSLLPGRIVEVGGFAIPPNLSLETRRVPWVEKPSTLLDWIGERQSAGIVFVPTREATSRISRLLSAYGKTAVVYHAGMSSEERRLIERQISERIPDVVVATSAFGMGMDHPHLEWAVLWQAPTSLLALAQAIGRVGRDRAKQAHALVLWDDEDFRLMEWTLAGSERNRKEFQDLRSYLRTSSCRRAELNRYFNGNSVMEFCENCGFCLEIRRYAKENAPVLREQSLPCKNYMP